MEIKIRIGNLELRKASYLCKEPEVPAYNIDKWEPNIYYKKYNKYKKDGDYYTPKDTPYIRIHKNCFKNPETCYSIASFEYNTKEGYYEFEFVGDRPLKLNKEELDNFWRLVKIGFTILNDSSCSSF